MVDCTMGIIGYLFMVFCNSMWVILRCVGVVGILALTAVAVKAAKRL